MQAFQVFKHSERGFEAVKRGFSWPAFFLTWIWAFLKGRWLAGAIALLAEFALFMFETKQGSLPFTIAVASLIHLIFGFKANYWRAHSLERQYFSLLGAINARNAADAIAKVAASGGTIPPELKAGRARAGFVPIPPRFQGIFAIITLTWKAAFRYRLFWVIVALLLVAVVGLPLLIKDDGTARGLTQIVVTYTLGALTALLGLCTLWLACGTLARDVEECQIQMVVVKPIARWQVWIGKWLGLVSINAVLLAVAWISIYSLLEWRAKKLSPSQLVKLRSEILVSRGSVKEDVAALDAQISQAADKLLKERTSQKTMTEAEQQTLRKSLFDQVRAAYQVVPSDGISRPWIVHFGAVSENVRNSPMFLRVKFNASSASQSGTFYAEWQVGNPNTTKTWQSELMSLAPDTFHEFSIPPNLIDQNGDLFVFFHNPNENVTLLFPLEDSLEVLYRQGGFALNFARGLAVILCWMAMLAAIGLAAASILSFPVAAFFSLGVLTVGLSSGTLANVVSEGAVIGYNAEAEGPQRGREVVNKVLVPAFRGALWVVSLVNQFSPVDSLSTGRSITWKELGKATALVVLMMGGLFGAFGIYVFHRRELATVQGST